MKFLFIKIKQKENVNIAKEYFNELLKKSVITVDGDSITVELKDKLPTDLKDISSMLNTDLLISSKVFESPELSVNLANELLSMVKSLDFTTIQEDHFTVDDLVVGNLGNKDTLKKVVLGKYYQDYQTLNEIKKFLECDMNVSKASSELYLHRNTLIYKINNFKEETGYNLKKFNDALVIWHLL